MPQQRHLITLFLALLPGIVPHFAFAQGERWYQVELLIFSNETGASNEQWEPLPQLAYPDKARFLVYPQQVTARAEEHAGVSEVDEFGRQFLRPDPAMLEEPQDATPDIPLRQAVPLPASDEQPAQGGDSELEAAPPPPTTPTPFIALPRSSAEFYGKAAYMQRSGNYRTLFHETWVQPVLEESDALPLIIDRSGDTGDWPRLQGSVKLHISRYLHLQTNLWLNTTGDYLPGQWQMPAPPLGPASLIVEEPEPAEDENLALALEPGAEASSTDLLAVEEMLEPESEPSYPWRHAVLMQQSRKMRSKEVHYLDHPLLGVVIKLMPLDEEQLQAMADAEFVEMGAAPEAQ